MAYQDVSAIKSKTDLIPASPAQQGSVLTQGFTSRLTPVVATFASGTTVTITPPVGQTWVVFVMVNGSGGADQQATVEYYDGAVWRMVAASRVPNQNGGNMYVYVSLRVSNTNNFRVGATGTTCTYFYWGYQE